MPHFSALGPKRCPQAFHKVAVVWKHLAHRNIVPLLGATIHPLQLVSVWISDENLAEYVSNNRDADTLSLVGIPFVALLMNSPHQ